MTTAITTGPDAGNIERVLVDGDLSGLTPQQRVSYYRQVCDSLGLNWLTKPFEYIRLNNRLVLYPTRNCTDQLRASRHINATIVAREKLEDVYVVTARATMPDGRQDESVGAVPLAGLKGEALANALMKAETKAKRRATLSLCGLSWADESEVGSIPAAQPVHVDVVSGEIVPPEPPSATVKRLGDVLGWENSDIAVAVRQMYDGRTFNELTAEEKRAFIAFMQERVDGLRAAEAAAAQEQQGLPF